MSSPCDAIMDGYACRFLSSEGMHGDGCLKSKGGNSKVLNAESLNMRLWWCMLFSSSPWVAGLEESCVPGLRMMP